MIIARAKKTDLENYVEIREKSLIEYYKITGKKIGLNHLELVNKIKKEFNEIVKAPSRFLLLAKENKLLIGFLIGTRLKNSFQSQGYIDDIFVDRDFRRKRIGTKLIINFISLMRSEKIKKLRLGVDIKNKLAIDLYKRMGFKITQYEMEAVK